MSMERTSGPAVSTRGLGKRFGGVPALSGVDLRVPEGAVYVLGGPNGAGKTTLLRVLMDLVRADEGTAEVLGLDTRVEGARARAHIGYVADRPDAAYGWLRVDALLRYHASFYPAWDAAYASELAAQLELRPTVRLDRLSRGEQRRVQLVAALAHRPPLLLLDEPTDGLDPAVRDRAVSALAAHLARIPTTILVTTHRIGDLDRLCDHLGVLRGGRLQAQFPRELLGRCLRRYRFEVPEGWMGAPELASAVVQRADSPREAAWTLWGEESWITERLRAAGATVRRVDTLPLEDAARVLIQAEPLLEGPGASGARSPIPAGV